MRKKLIRVKKITTVDKDINREMDGNNSSERLTDKDYFESEKERAAEWWWKHASEEKKRERRREIVDDMVDSIASFPNGTDWVSEDTMVGFLELLDIFAARVSY